MEFHLLSNLSKTSSMWPLLFGALVLSFILTLVILLLFIRIAFHLQRSKWGSKAPIIGILHPYSSAGGGGERVLWFTVRALKQAIPDAKLILYTGDLNLDEAEVLSKVQTTFGLQLSVSDIQFVRLKYRHLVEAKLYPRFTLLGQSVGSMILAFEALYRCPPDLFIDTTGYAFSYPLAKWLAGSHVACYVHYPTISTDMLQLVRNRNASYNNQSSIASSSWKSNAKLLYYHIFAALYGFVGRRSDVVMTNSSWTRAHIDEIWGNKSSNSTIFPPCDVETYTSAIPLGPRPCNVISLAQFRPEKNHSLQLRSFAQFLRQVDAKWKAKQKPRLWLVGGCRGAEDLQRLEGLKQLAIELEISEFVEFFPNASHEQLGSLLSQARIGLHTMLNEHFGICVVDYMAAGVIPLAHDSGGPRSDIVVPFEGNQTGILASDEQSYADVLQKLLTASQNEDWLLKMQAAARQRAQQFSEQNYEEQIQHALTPVLSKLK